ncbi:MAG: hypothetical protein L0H24_03835 [Microlunatus sp.]|nr:hypothetical protein [Microlunatus sp.]
MIRYLVAQQWQVTRERFDFDEVGRGVAVYRIDAGRRTWRLVAFSQVLADGERQDRVIAAAWDVTLALIEGDLDQERMAALRDNVPRQEAGRADPDTVIWGRGNRSTRFFDAVVTALAAGRQPDSAMFEASPYLMRSTAFYSNGKFGLADFERFGPEHPFSVPYRSHFLAAWLMRELSLDLVEHCARAINPGAAVLDPRWRRYLGLGNATGLGVVPYVINHPQILDAWAHLRELPLAEVRGRVVDPGDPDVARVRELFDRAVIYLQLGGSTDIAPFPNCAVVAAQVAQVRELVEEYAAHGTIHGARAPRPWEVLHAAADDISPGCRAVVASILVELTGDLDAVIEASLARDERTVLRPWQSVGELVEAIDQHYDWVRQFDFDDAAQQAYFWFSSEDNEEPRRGRRGIDPGEQVEHGTDVARAVATLRTDLDAADPADLVAQFMLSHPWHRGAISRVQSVGELTYGEVRTNLLAEDFLPLNVQRLQLAVYGMENFVPQSTDWLRVTLFVGAPRVSDLAEGTADDDWIFVSAPGAAERLEMSR